MGLILCLLGLYMGDSSLDSTDAESIGMAMGEAEELPISLGFFGGMILSRGTVLGAAEASGSGSSCSREAFSGSTVAMDEAEELPISLGFFGGMILSRGTVLGAAEASGSGSCRSEAFSGSAVAMDEAEELPISLGFFGGMILTRGMILRAAEASGFGSSCNRETLSGSAVAVA